MASIAEAEATARLLARPRVRNETGITVSRGCGDGYAEACATSDARERDLVRCGVLPSAVLGPALEVALELPGDRLATGLGQVGGVAGLLEGPDVVRDVLVLLGELVDTALPGPCVLGELPERDAALEQLLDLPEQGERRLRARWLRDVVRDGGPVGHGRYVEPYTGVLEHADDPGRAFVRRLLEL